MKKLSLLLICVLCSLCSFQQNEMSVVAQMGQGGPVSGSLICEDNQILISYNSHKVVLWDIPSGLEFNSINVPQRVSSVAYIDRRNIVIGTKEGRVSIYDAIDQKEKLFWEHATPIKDLYYSESDPHSLLVATDKMYLINLDTQQESVLVNEPVFKIHWNELKAQFQLITERGKVRLFGSDHAPKGEIDLRSSIFTKKWNSKSKYNQAKYFAFSDEFDQLIFCKKDKILVFGLKNSKLLHKEGPFYFKDDFQSLTVNSREKKVFAISKTGLIFRYQLTEKPSRSNFYEKSFKTPHISGIRQVTTSQDGIYYATSSVDYSIILWDASKDEMVKRFYSKSFEPTSVEYYPDENEFVFGDNIGSIHKVNFKNIDSLYSHFRISYKPIQDIAIHQDSSLMVLPSNSTPMHYVWGDNYPRAIRKSGESAGKLKSHKKNYKSMGKQNIELSPSGRYLSIGTRYKEYRAYIIDLEKNKRIKKFDFKKARNFERYKFKMGKQYVFSPNEKHMIAVSPGHAYGTKNVHLNVGHVQLFSFENQALVFRRHLCPTNKDHYQTVDWINNEKVIGRRLSGALNLLSIHDSSAFVIDSNVHFFDVNRETATLLYATDESLFSLDLKSMKEKYSVPISVRINDISIDEVGDRMLVSSSDGSVQYRDFLSGELLLRFFAVKLDEMVILTADNYYKADKGALDGIGFRLGDKIFPPEQFDLKFNRPDIVLQELGSTDTLLIDAYHLAYQKRLKKMGFTEEMLSEEFHLPTLNISNRSEIPTVTDQETLNIGISAYDDLNQIDRINVYVNDVAIYGSKGISLRHLSTDKYDDKLSVNLAKGNNKVQISALSTVGTESYKETIELQCTAGKDKPDLYIVTIGVSNYMDSDFNLTYAAKDAEDLVTAYQNQNYFEKVHHRTLTNESVTKENFAQLKNFLSGADINDQVILFVAGHGVLDSEFDYYFASYDIDFSDPAKQGIAYEDLESLLDGIRPLKKLLFMDTCHSGEVDKDDVQFVTSENEEEESDIVFRKVGSTIENKENQLGLHNTNELMKDLFTDFRKGTGSTVISSAGGVEFAMESAEWQNGLFTYCLISGLTDMKADLNKDKEVSISELQSYIRTEVNMLSNGLQTPTSRIVNQTLDYRIW